jgi:hypothetical protein
MSALDERTPVESAAMRNIQYNDASLLARNMKVGATSLG